MALFETAALLTYLGAATVLVLIPGPGTAWVIAQAMAGGTARGIRAGVGLETATLLHATAAGLGLSAVLASSAAAFEAVKYAGAAYLIWLGIKAWRESMAQHSHADTTDETRTVHATHAIDESRAAPSARDDHHSTVYWRSVITGLLNPKVALFFLAFLPQFVQPQRGLVWLQFLVLGALLSMIGITHSTVLSVLFGRLGRRIARRGRLAQWGERAAGTTFIALGVRLAVQQRS